MDDLTEEELRQIVSGQTTTTPTPTPASVSARTNFWDPANYQASVNDGLVLQPMYGTISSGHGEEGGMYEYGPITGLQRYKEGQTAPGQTYEILDPATGKVTGTGQFKEQSRGFFGDLWGGVSQAAADLGPILQFTPLAPLVRAVSALSAAERGDILGALASGLPLADKIPGLDAATVSTLKDIGKYASVGKAAQSGDWQQVLSAASQIPGVGTNIPQELKTVSDYASKAALLQRAAKGDISAIAALAKSSGDVPTKKFGDVASGDLIEGFFAPGGEGYDSSQDAEDYIRSLMNFEEALPPDVTEFLPAQEVIRERISLEDRYPAPEGTVTDTSSSEPADQRFDVTAKLPGLNEDFTLEDLFPGTGRSTSSDGTQRFDITGTRITPDYTLEDLMPGTGRSTSDQYTEVPDRTPGTLTTGTVTPDDDRTVPTTPVPTPAPTPAPSPGPSPGPSPAPKPATPGSGMDLAALFALLGAMSGQGQDRQAPAQVNVARGTPESPFGLMYDLRG